MFLVYGFTLTIGPSLSVANLSKVCRHMLSKRLVSCRNPETKTRQMVVFTGTSMHSILMLYDPIFQNNIGSESTPQTPLAIRFAYISVVEKKETTSYPTNPSLSHLNIPACSFRHAKLPYHTMHLPPHYIYRRLKFQVYQLKDYLFFNRSLHSSQYHFAVRPS